MTATEREAFAEGFLPIRWSCACRASPPLLPVVVQASDHDAAIAAKDAEIERLRESAQREATSLCETLLTVTSTRDKFRRGLEGIVASYDGFTSAKEMMQRARAALSESRTTLGVKHG
jgi:hypothetical protein